MTTVSQKINYNGVTLKSDKYDFDKQSLSDLLNDIYSTDIEEMIKRIPYPNVIPHDILTGMKDIDRQILLNLNDSDLTSVRLTNKYLKSLCDDEEFWKLRYIQNFGKEKAIIAGRGISEQSCLKTGQTPWKDAYIHRKIIESRCTIFDMPMIYLKDTEKTKEIMDQLLKKGSFPFTHYMYSSFKLIPKSHAPVDMKDGDILTDYGNGIKGIVIDIGEYFMAGAIIKDISANSDTLIFELRPCSMYELFKHGLNFFKPFVKYLYTRRTQKTVKLIFKTHSAFPVFVGKQKKYVLAIEYDNNGNIFMLKDKKKIYTYSGMTLELSVKHRISSTYYLKHY
jgi:hypothetical protein